MKKIAFIPCGVLPIPATKGGAVENLVQQLLDLNDLHGKYEMIVYSPYDEKAKVCSKKYRYTTFIFIQTNGFKHKIQTAFYRVWGIVKSKLSGYDFQNYFLRQIIKDLRTRGHIDYIIFENAAKYAIEIHKHFPSSKIIQHYHNIPEEKNISTVIDTCTDYYFCISAFIKQKVMEIFNTDDAKAKLFYNSIDVCRFHQTIGDRRNNLRNKLGIKKDDFVVIYTGRLQPYKGIKELLKGISYIQNNQVKLLVVGGSFYSGAKKSPFIKELEKFAHRLDDRVVFTGFVPYETIPNYYAIADIAVVPSLWEEPFALTALEAMASSLPVIATKTGGLSEVVNEECAILLNIDEQLSGNIAEAIINLYSNKLLCKKMSLASCEHAKTFAIENYWKRFNELICSL